MIGTLVRMNPRTLSRTSPSSWRRNFFEFDIFDKDARRFLSLEKRLAMLRGTGLATVPVLHRGRASLLFTALLHDAGKPATSAIDSETGRMRSPKHSLAGAEIARRVLRELGCDLQTREEIVALVRYHGRPPYLLEKEKPDHAVIFLSWLVDTRLLYWFALADTRGRQARETSRPEENLHLWKLVAEERGCFGVPFAFANNQSRFLIYRGQLSSVLYFSAAPWLTAQSQPPVEAI
jgi:HD domain